MLLEFAAVAVLMSVPEPSTTTFVPRVRALSSVARFVIDEATKKSPTIVSLIAQLQRHEIIVYVDLEPLTSARGATSILSVNPGGRMLRVLVDVGLDPRQQIEVLGHELHHALEIARAETVVDQSSFVAHFKRIGYPTGRASYETDEAKRIEAAVRRDLSGGDLA